MRLSQTLKSASFKLTAAYAGLFALSVCILAVLTYFSVTGGLSAQFHSRIRSESQALQTVYRSGGVAQVLRIIGQRQRGRLVYGLDYSLWDTNGRHLFGSLPDVPCKAGWTTLAGPPDGDEAPGEQEELKLYVTPLDGQACLLIGDDWGKVQGFGGLILKTFAWISLLSLTMAIVGGIFLSSRFLKRIETITKTAEAIIEGDMKRRVPRRTVPDDLDRLAATFNRMLDRTTGLMESLRHLSNDIAHDLRTPLGRLRQLLEPARHQNLSPDEHRALLQRGVREIDAILDMFAALLRIAQIESGSRRAGFQRFCLSQLISDICDTFAPALEEDGRELRQVIVPGIWISGDPELLTLSLANLLENANTHTPPSARITVSVCRVTSGVELCVADNGPGVPARDSMRIFQRFYRVDESRSTKGNGLGLSIVAAVAELHNASIFAADNRPGLRVGMTFPKGA